MSRCMYRNLDSSLKGFSLLELVVVLTLLLFSTLVAMPVVSKGLDALTLETAGRDLIVRMRQARSNAISRQEVFRIVLGKREGAPDSYVLTGDFEEKIQEFFLPSGVSLEVEKQAFPVKISFYPNGRSSGQLLTLKRDRGRSMRILIDPVTGFAMVVR